MSQYSLVLFLWVHRQYSMILACLQQFSIMSEDRWSSSKQASFAVAISPTWPSSVFVDLHIYACEFRVVKWRTWSLKDRGYCDSARYFRSSMLAVRDCAGQQISMHVVASAHLISYSTLLWKVSIMITGTSSGLEVLAVHAKNILSVAGTDDFMPETQGIFSSESFDKWWVQHFCLAVKFVVGEVLLKYNCSDFWRKTIQNAFSTFSFSFCLWGTNHSLFKLCSGKSIGMLFHVGRICRRSSFEYWTEYWLQSSRHVVVRSVNLLLKWQSLSIHWCCTSRVM